MEARLVADRPGLPFRRPHGLANTHETRCPCWGAVPGPVGNPGRPCGRPGPGRRPRRPRPRPPLRLRPRRSARCPRRPRLRPRGATAGARGPAGAERPRRRGRVCRDPGHHRDRPAACRDRSGAARRRALLPDPGQRLVDRAETYLYYIQTRRSRPSPNAWVPCTTNREDLVEDFKRLWATNFLDDLSIEVDRLRRSPTASSASSCASTWRSASGSRSSTTSAATSSSRPRSTRS